MRQTITIELDGPVKYDPFEGSQGTPREYNHLSGYFTEFTPPFEVLSIKIDVAELTERVAL